MRRHLVSWIGLLALTVTGSACTDPEARTLWFEPDPWEAPDALPGFASSGDVVLHNGTGATYTVTALAFSSSDEGGLDAERFEVVPADGAALPVVLPPGGSVDLTLVFSPLSIRGYEAVLTASAALSDYTVGGGGCSAGCGRDAPSDLVEFTSLGLVGFGDAGASYEDCTDGVDNDADELIDCADPDCLTHPDCTLGEDVCDDGIDNDGDGLIDCLDDDCAGDPACGGDDEICTDGVDNDGDGRIDCDDPDCIGDPACVAVEGCDPAGPLTCGEFLVSSTAGAPSEWVDYCGAGFGGWSGPEEVWTYVADAPGEVLVSATADWDLDLTVLQARVTDGGELACDPNECVATSWNPPSQPTEETVFFAEPDTVYFIVLDGWSGDAGAYDLLIDCDGGSFEICDDGVDNDGDGLADCDDPDCFGFPGCDDPPDGLCAPLGAAECGQTIDGFNSEPGSTNDVIDWCGNGFDGWTGPEVAYLFVPETSGEVAVSIGGLSDDLDLTVLLADLSGPDDALCNPELCIDANWDGGNAPETVIFDAFVGTTYLFAIDGWAGAISDFQLTVECAGGGTELNCADGVDNDSDGLVDCDDPDCFAFPDCGGGPEICDDGVDNNGDGLVDCDDILACAAHPSCDYGTGDCCVDNGDPGCDNQAGEACVCTIDPYCCQVAWDFICAEEFEDDCGGTCGGPGTEVCDNGADDDGDGLVDCDDADCDADPACVGPGIELDCANGLDDDFDGFVDCLDSDCLFDPACVPGAEDCVDGIDNDGDGAIDCEDSDCTFDPACDAGDGDCCAVNGSPGCEDEVGEDCVCDLDPYCCDVTWDGICADEYQDVCGGTCAGVEDCTNGLDDDGDGLVDCDDTDCLGTPLCAGEICTNGADDDGDGLVDCADPDCLGDPGCALVETDCTNALDDDGDGLIDCSDPDCLLDPACLLPGTETNCANGLDDDGDGAVDCDDPDCTLDPNCNLVLTETSCTNGIDDDADGFTDCDDSDCAAFPSCVNPPETDCDNGIDDDVDGFTDCNDSDCAFDPDCATGEDDCADGVDNDGDGDVDCDDADCSADVACVDPGNCSPMGNLECGDVVTGSNDMPGSTNVQDIYCGYNPGGWSGPEVSWVFTPDFDGLVEIELTGLTADLDIQAMNEEAGGGCDQDDCEANGWNPPPQDEFMDWYAFAGTPYYILIDGWNGAVSPFTMSVSCTPSSEVVCDDGLDDDGDGDIDCADVDCLGTPACPETACDDGVDNDADGQIDCADPDCFAAPVCVPESNCVDGIDNDGDGDVDCDDDDCDDAPACAPDPAATCLPVEGELGCGDVVFGDVTGESADIDSYCGTGGASFFGPELTYLIDHPAATTVTVSLFNLTADLDLFALGDDPSSGGCDPDDCVAYNPSFGASPEEIDFGVAAGTQTWISVDGWNGAVSAFGLAVSCSTTPDPEVCDDGADNDGDGDVDCDDSDCAGDPGCLTPEVCDDGADNDGDGDVDCDDSDCAGDPGCPIVLFSSVGDDPGDFVNFSLASHASATIWEQGVPDTSAQSGSGPSAPYAGSTSWCTGCAASAVDGGRFNGYLIAQPFVFDLSPFSGGTLELSWAHWGVPGLVDVARVSVSPDGGTTIDDVWGPIVFSSTDWETEVVDVSTYLGGDLSFGFRFDSITGFDLGGDGWYVDDVELIYYP